MSLSFYQYLMNQKDSLDLTDPISEFARNAFRDNSFPKTEKDFQILSEYVELNANYLPSMDIFDEAYQKYQEGEQ